MRDGDAGCNSQKMVRLPLSGQVLSSRIHLGAAGLHRSGYAIFSSAPNLTPGDRAESAFDAPINDARIVSGCFMLIRRSALDKTGGFDADFFIF
jgi:GT2 family glycosyltransferase